MKTIRIFVLIVLTLLLASCVAVPAVHPTNGFAQSLVALPDEGRLLIMSLVTAAVAWLLMQLSTLLGTDLSGNVQPIAAGLAPLLVTIAEHFLGMIPPIYDNIVLSIIHLIVVGIGSLGMFLIINKSKAKQVHSLLG